MFLACDAFETTSAPGTDNLVAWSGMHRTSVQRILDRLLTANKVRPALLDRETTRGRNRTSYRLLVTTEPPTVGGLLISGQPPTQPPTEPPSNGGRLTASQPPTEPPSNGGHSLSLSLDTPSPSVDLSESQLTVARLLGYDERDERLESVEEMLKVNGAKGPGWLHSVHRNGDLARLLEECAGKASQAKVRAVATDARRCPHGVINGQRIPGQCPDCYEADRTGPLRPAQSEVNR